MRRETTLFRQQYKSFSFAVILASFLAVFFATFLTEFLAIFPSCIDTSFYCCHILHMILFMDLYMRREVLPYAMQVTTRIIKRNLHITYSLNKGFLTWLIWMIYKV